MVSREGWRNFEILGIMSPLLIAIGLVIAQSYYNFEKRLINQNRPYTAQIREISGDSIPDLLIYSKDGRERYTLVGQGNGRFLNIEDVVKAKEDLSKEK